MYRQNRPNKYSCCQILRYSCPIKKYLSNINRNTIIANAKNEGKKELSNSSHRNKHITTLPISTTYCDKTKLKTNETIWCTDKLIFYTFINISYLRGRIEDVNPR